LRRTLIFLGSVFLIGGLWVSSAAGSGDSRSPDAEKVGETTATTTPPDMSDVRPSPDGGVAAPAGAIRAVPVTEHEAVPFDAAAAHADAIAPSKRTVDEQLRTFQDAAERAKADVDVAAMATVSITLNTPLPIKALQDARIAGKYGIPDEAVNVTVYAEMDDGYPITITGEPRFDLAGEIVRFVTNANESGRLTYNPADVADRVVILGFTLSLDDYGKLSDSLHDLYGPSVDVVSVSRRPEALRPIDRQTLDRVAEHTASYENGEVGR
jgi:hypothetical protein